MEALLDSLVAPEHARLLVSLPSPQAAFLGGCDVALQGPHLEYTGF